MTTRRCCGIKQAVGDVLDAHQAARLLGAHVETVRRLARKGEVPSYKIGKDWRFREKALCRWMETQYMRERSPLVLVVDDEKSIRETLSALLEKDGYRVAAAENGKRAVELLQAAIPAVVLLDMMMPGMHGVDVLKVLRSMNPDLPVIMITGYPDSTMVAEALHYPPITLLPKPVAYEVVRKTVRMLLEGARRL